jgi:hypothetical protein
MSLWDSADGPEGLDEAIKAAFKPIKLIAGKAGVDDDIKAEAINQIAYAAESIRATLYSPDGPARLLRKEKIELGSSTGSDTDSVGVQLAALKRIFGGKSTDEIMDYMVNFFGPLQGERDANIRLVNAARVVKGDLAVSTKPRSNRLQVEDDFDLVSDEHTRVVANHDAEKSRADTLKQQLDAAIAAGDPVALKTERDNLKAERDACRAGVARLKAATSVQKLGYVRFRNGKVVVIDDTKLQDVDKAELGITS